jgi:hypothetical protein
LKSGGVIRQEVSVGAANDIEIVILEGLVSGDEVLLTEPKGGSELKLATLE